MYKNKFIPSEKNRGYNFNKVCRTGKKTDEFTIKNKEFLNVSILIKK